MEKTKYFTLVDEQGYDHKEDFTTIIELSKPQNWQDIKDLMAQARKIFYENDGDISVLEIFLEKLEERYGKYKEINVFQTNYYLEW